MGPRTFLRILINLGNIPRAPEPFWEQDGQVVLDKACFGQTAARKGAALKPDPLTQGPR